jgi:hypothetical protein
VSVFGPAWRERLELISLVMRMRRKLGQPYPTLDELDAIRDLAANRR